MIQKAKNYLRGLAILCVVFLVLVCVNFGQLSSLILLPFSRRLFRRYNRWIAGAWWGVAVGIAQRVSGPRLILSGDIDSDFTSENAILISNHQNSTDIYALMIFAKSKGRLGDLKWFAKKKLKYVPGIGWGMQFLDSLFLERNWEADVGTINSVFSSILKDRTPMWLVTFVEGTRITEKKVKESQAFAAQRNLPKLEKVLLPRTRGFIATVKGLSTHAQAIYDISLIYPSGSSTLWQTIQGMSPEIRFHIKRYPTEHLPKDPDQLATWLMTRFQEKDLRMSSNSNV